jgi:hypothetical protein
MHRRPERRLFPRYSAANLVVDIDGVVYEVDDISLGGLRIQGKLEGGRRSVAFLLCPQALGEIDRGRGVRGRALVRAHYDNATALEFDGATLPLLKLVVRQASLELGVEPFALK